jgi:DNA repair protein RecO (recombination protein O)
VNVIERSNDAHRSAPYLSRVALLVSDAIVLHAFDYLESSRIVRLVTRDGGMRSAIAKGARRSHRRFGGGLDLFAQGTAFLHHKPGRELDTLSGFEDVRTRTGLAEDLERFGGAGAIAEITLRFGKDGADDELFAAVAESLDGMTRASGLAARVATIAGAWRIVAALGFGPTLAECAQCDTPLGEAQPALFTHSAGGVLCDGCAPLSVGGRKLPWAARVSIAEWMEGRRESAPDEATLDETTLDEATVRAHQRLLREFLEYHLHDGRPLRAFDLWEGSALSAASSAPAAAPAVARPIAPPDAPPVAPPVRIANFGNTESPLGEGSNTVVPHGEGSST